MVKTWRDKPEKLRCDFCGRVKNEHEMVPTLHSYKGRKYRVCRSCWGGYWNGRGDLVPIEYRVDKAAV